MPIKVTGYAPEIAYPLHYPASQEDSIVSFSRDEAIEAAVVIIQDEVGRVLLLLRSEEHKNFPGQLCFPGGKVDNKDRDKATIIGLESDEIHMDLALKIAAQRELYEETGIVILRENLKHSMVSCGRSPHDGRVYLIHFYTLKEVGKILDSGVSLSSEHVSSIQACPDVALSMTLAGQATEDGVRLAKALAPEDNPFTLPPKTDYPYTPGTKPFPLINI